MPISRIDALRRSAYEEFMMPSAVLMWALMQAPAASPLPPSTIALVETFADGRVNYELTSPKPAWMWTPLFPRLKDWQPPPGSLPVTALKLARVLVGSDVRVDVSVLLGTAHEEEAPVAAVVVRHGAHVMVNELRKFGLEPVDLSLAEAAPFTPYLPTVFSVTPNLEIADVALLNAPYPGYRIRTEIEALPDQDEAQLAVAQTRMRMAKTAALADVTRFEQDGSGSHSGPAGARWLKYSIARYDRWIARLAP
jgi:hypothetical protein